MKTQHRQICEAATTEIKGKLYTSVQMALSTTGPHRRLNVRQWIRKFYPTAHT